MTRTLARNLPLTCAGCGVNLATVDHHIAGWAAGGLTYWCEDCDPRKTP